MDHIAIMKKSWRLTEKILSGDKVVESRWYKNKSAPWGKISTGDTVYFKNSGEPVSIKAHVARVLEFSELTPSKVKNILKNYGQQDGIAEKDLPYFLELFKNKKYCLLIFLVNAKKVRPFEINKTGFGMMSAWIAVKKIKNIKRSFVLSRVS